MEITWKLMGLNDGWKSEKVKVRRKNFKKCLEKKLFKLYFLTVPHSMTNSTIFLFRMEL